MEETQQTPMEDPSDRKRFTRRVFTLLTLELVFLVTVIYPFVFNDDFKNFLATEVWLHMFLVFCSILTIVNVLCTVPSFPTKFPYNFMYLQLLILSIGVVWGTISMFFDVSTFYYVFVQTLILVIVLTIIAYFSKVDITETKYIIILSVVLAAIALVTSTLIYFLFAGWKTLKGLALRIVIMVIMCAYFLYDTQLILRGDHGAVSNNFNDYIFAVMHLFMDIGFWIISLIRGTKKPIFEFVK